MTLTATRPPTAPARFSRGRGVGVAVLFTVTAFFGAALLFTVQPLVARLLLPAYGGSATVWSTCSLFFQVLLIAGYVYSHVATSRLPRRLQPRLHLVVLAVPLLVLPLALPLDAAPGPGQTPALWLLRTLALMIGLPFVVLATTGPLLQRWYSWSTGPRRDDPYFLFAAGNVGSFGGLLAYPFVLEPHLSLGSQTRVFSAAFLVFAALSAACGFLSLRGEQVAGERTTRSRPPFRRTLVWTAYAFVPSCLMLAVTRHLSTDVAPIPLLWVAPLALYLATFVAAFAVRSRQRPGVSPRVAAGLGFAGVVVTPLGATSLPIALTYSLLLVGVAGYAAHRMLAADRPEPEHLTTFYLAIAVGGALGGLVNGLAAPLVFDTVLEYPLTLALLPLLCVGLDRGRGRPGRRLAVAALMTLLLSLAATQLRPAVPATAAVLLAVAGFVLVGYVLSRSARVSAGCLVAAVVLLPSFATGEVVERERTFYGTYEVVAAPGATMLSHGSTLHGLQSTEAGTEGEPTAYYSRTGPLGDVMEVQQPRDVTTVGLGVGTIAAFGGPGDRYTFVEIDEAVVDIARDERYFTFLADSEAEIDVLVGDGRLLAQTLPPGRSDLVVLDAFSSDSIPVHLLTQEAFDVYAAVLRDDGAMAVHISNRHFDLAPVLAATADHLGWHAVLRGERGSADYSTPSTWVVLSPRRGLADALVADRGWTSLDGSRQVRWTDDYSSILSVLK